MPHEANHRQSGHGFRTCSLDNRKKQFDFHTCSVVKIIPASTPNIVLRPTCGGTFSCFVFTAGDGVLEIAKHAYSRTPAAKHPYLAAAVSREGKIYRNTYGNRGIGNFGGGTHAIGRVNLTENL